MSDNYQPTAVAEMLIRRPVEEVFRAFIDPAVTTRFWFTKSSGALEPGRSVTWEWEMYGASAQVDVKAVEPNKRILIEWGAPDATTAVEWTFTSRADGTTFVGITNTGFGGDDEQKVKGAISSTEGFTLVLAGLKALLEHGVALNLIADRFPDAHVAP